MQNYSRFNWWLATNVKEEDRDRLILSYPQLQKLAKENQKIRLLGENEQEIVREDCEIKLAPNGTVHATVNGESIALFPQKQLTANSIPKVSNYWLIAQDNGQILGPKDLEFDKDGFAEGERIFDLQGELDNSRRVNIRQSDNISQLVRLSKEGKGAYLAIGQQAGKKSFYLLKGMATKSIIQAFAIRSAYGDPTKSMIEEII